MNLRAIFGGQPNNQQPGTQLNQQAADPNAVNNNTTVPNDNTQKSDGTGPTAFPKAAEGTKSPLADYKEVFKTEATNTGMDSAVPSFNIDHASLLKTAQGIDFTKSISPELLAKATAGDAAALAQVINQGAQAGFAQATAVTAGIVQDALKKQADSLNSTVVPEILRRNAAGQSLREDNAELFANPAVAPVYNLIERQMATAYPTASAAELKAHTERYMSEFTDVVAGAKGMKISKIEDPAKARGEETDWAKYMGM